jgi:nitrile hydratase accessory protein
VTQPVPEHMAGLSDATQQVPEHMAGRRDATQQVPEHIAIPRDAEGGPVFEEPWQAQAFAMTLKLYERGAFTWPEWAEYLAQEIQRAQAGGDPDLGDTYYLHWLAALERIVADKGLIATAELAHRKEEWSEAAAATPHGKPIELNAPGRG